MKFDFYIDEIKFDFHVHGTGKLTLSNDQQIKKDFVISRPEQLCNIEIKFEKEDPADLNSYATIQHVWINGYDLKERFKGIDYKIDKDRHSVEQTTIPNNLYFGYQGSMSFSIEHKNDLLSRAAWTLADNEFAEVKWPLMNDQHRKKNFHNVHRDAVYMFTGCLSPKTPILVDTIDEMKIADLRNPMHHDHRAKIENWINRSERVKIKNFPMMNNFTTGTGVTQSLSVFLQSAQTLFMPKKTYFHNGESIKDKDIPFKDAFSEVFEEGSRVLFELPSPWYSIEKTQQRIEEARKADCYIALDLTWLPIIDCPIEIDLAIVDEVFFSMNKCWPIVSLRPAFRWSKKRINDSQTFDYEVGAYPKIPVNVFFKLIDKFDFDYSYNRYKTDQKNVCDQFGLKPTNVLWFATHDQVKHNYENYISGHYFLDDFVCVVELLNHKGKYFW